MIQKLQKPINFYVRGVKFASLINILILLFACNNAQQEGNSSSGKADNILIPVFDTDDNIGYIDITGKWGIQPQFQDGEAFNNVGLARVKQGDTWGVIDSFPIQRQVWCYRQNRQNGYRA